MAICLPSGRGGEALDRVHARAGRKGEGVELEIAVVADGVDHQCVAFPVSRPNPPGSWARAWRVLAAEPDTPVHPRLFVEQVDLVRGLHDGDGVHRHDHRIGRARPARGPAGIDDLPGLHLLLVAVDQRLRVGQQRRVLDLEEEPFGLPHAATCAVVRGVLRAAGAEPNSSGSGEDEREPPHGRHLPRRDDRRAALRRSGRGRHRRPPADRRGAVIGHLGLPRRAVEFGIGDAEGTCSLSPAVHVQALLQFHVVAMRQTRSVEDGVA